MNESTSPGRTGSTSPATAHDEGEQAAGRRGREADPRGETPVLYVGGGVIKANATEELVELATTGRLPVVTTLMARGAFPDSHELCLGMPGMHGDYTAVTAMQKADLSWLGGIRPAASVRWMRAPCPPDPIRYVAWSPSVVVGIRDRAGTGSHAMPIRLPRSTPVHSAPATERTIRVVGTVPYTPSQPGEGRRRGTLAVRQIRPAAASRRGPGSRSRSPRRNRCRCPHGPRCGRPA